MGKLSEVFSGIIEKIKKMSMGKKIAFSLLFVGIVVSFIMFSTYLNNNKYGLLFSNLPAEDAKLVSDTLKEKKVDMKIKGNAIYVPKDQVDELRLELAPQLTDGSKGYELLDTGNSFGMTDEEFKLQKIRITQGELEKTIKSFPQIENARVHLTPAEDSVFVKDSQPGKAAVYVKLKYGTSLTPNQVKSIIALISGSVENVPKENVQVIDDKMNLLSKGIFDESNNDTDVTTVDRQQNYESDFEAKLEKTLLDMLEPAIGRNKVKVKVNADLDFDSKEKSEIVYDPNKVAVSTHVIKESTKDSGTNTSQSPVDSNMDNTTTTNSDGTTTTRDEETNNYNVGQTETKVISAPGEIKRLTASVIIDGNLDDNTKSEIQKAVAAAIGIKPDRGDEISIIGMKFDPSYNNDASSVYQEMAKQEAADKKTALTKEIAIGVAGLAGFIILLVALRRIFKGKKKVEEITGIDVVIGDQIPPKEKIEFPPLELEEVDEKQHIEKEIKKYATEKPEQVADIVKSWLAEDERW